MYVHGNGRDIVTIHSGHTMWFLALAFGIPVSFLLQPRPLNHAWYIPENMYEKKIFNPLRNLNQPMEICGVITESKETSELTNFHVYPEHCSAQTGLS